MPGTRAERKSPLIAVLTQLGLGIALGLAVSQPEHGAATERIGRQARPRIHLWGVAWHFCNPGNRAAFIDHPDIYMPMFGGYDPIAVGRGVATSGHPRLWMIVGQRLFLFRDTGSREAFAKDSAQSIARRTGPVADSHGARPVRKL
jgi:hypothetical protein